MSGSVTSSGGRLRQYPDGSYGSVVEVVGVGPKFYTLLAAAAATGQAVNATQGGDYLWRVEGAFDGASVTLQTLGLDGVSWFPLQRADGTAVAVTAQAAVRVSLGQSSTIRATVSGGNAGTAIYSALAGL